MSSFTRKTQITQEERALITAAKLLELVPTEGHAQVVRMAASMVLTTPAALVEGKVDDV